MTLQMLQVHQLNRDLGFYKTETSYMYILFIFCSVTQGSIL